ncbi:MAG TPA: glycosyltransferase [Gammaproteobacteria bacterium]|nr:glycosyltransferase [Gammaproteobacteria bacterium]
MKVLHVCYADKEGGGAIGAHRLHTSMLSQNVDSTLLVIKKRTYDPTVQRVPRHIRLANLAGRHLSRFLLQLQKPADKSYRSLNILPTGIGNYINTLDADIVQLHWINENTIGIPEFRNIKKPVVWKLPDMWAFSGSEHYPPGNERAEKGYTKLNRIEGAGGLDIDRLIWKLKKKYWKDLDLTIVSPSKWLADRARASDLFRNYPVHNIANPINLDRYRPAANIASARKFFRLPVDKKLVLFVSLTRLTDPRKGFGFLEKCLEEYSKSINPAEYRFVVMGRRIPVPEIGGIEVINLGYLSEEADIALAYSAADVLAAPSYADNLPNTIKESMACGTPCVAFNTGGIPDMITHRESGYLCPVDDITEFCNGLQWVLSGKIEKLSIAARDAAIKFHDPENIVKMYLDLYENILANNRGNS